MLGAPPDASPTLAAWRESGTDRFALKDGRYRDEYAGRAWTFRAAGGDAGGLDLDLLAGWDPR